MHLNSKPSQSQGHKLVQVSNVHNMSLMNYLFKKFYIQIKTVAPYNHQSLQVEFVIKSLSTILTEHLAGPGKMQIKYLTLATLVYNTLNTFSKLQHI